MRTGRALKRLRVIVAWMMFTGFLAVFVAGSRLWSIRAGQVLASTQFMPSLAACLGGAAVSLTFVVILATSLALGRLYCGAICPMGVLQDVIARVAAWVRSKKRVRRFTRSLTWVRHVFLWGTAAAVVMGWTSLAISLTDPFSHFGRISVAIVRPALISAVHLLGTGLTVVDSDVHIRTIAPWAGAGVIAVPALVLSVVVAMAVWRDRLYCNSFCPVGTLLGIFSRWAAFRVAIDPAACRKCGECSSRCKAHCIDLRTGTVDGSRCVACFNCLGRCDSDAIHYNWRWRRISQTRVAPAVDAPRRAFLTQAAIAAAALVTARAGLARTSDELISPVAERRKRAALIAPPGSESVARFFANCTACQLCVGACPTGALQPGGFPAGGLLKPRLDYAVGGCAYLCHRCGEICPTGAIRPLDLAEKQATRIGVATVELAQCEIRTKAIRCSLCVDSCPTKALTFAVAADGTRIPAVQPLLCIGCGLCEHACPVRPGRAIAVAGRRIHNRVRTSLDDGSLAAASPGFRSTVTHCEPSATAST